MSQERPTGERQREQQLISQVFADRYVGRHEAPRLRRRVPGDPLGTSTISVAGGTTGENEDGLPFARASAVRLDLVPSLNGGVELALSDCLSVAGASVQPEETTTTTSTTTTQPTLPRTGGTGVNGLALFGAVGLAGISLLLLRRSAVA